jgi:hypothetical protein
VVFIDVFVYAQPRSADQNLRRVHSISVTVMRILSEHRESKDSSPALDSINPFRHVTKNPSLQLLWNLHLQTVTPATPLECAFTKVAGCR